MGNDAPCSGKNLDALISYLASMLAPSPREGYEQLAAAAVAPHAREAPLMDAAVEEGVGGVLAGAAPESAAAGEAVVPAGRTAASCVLAEVGTGRGRSRRGRLRTGTPGASVHHQRNPAPRALLGATVHAGSKRALSRGLRRRAGRGTGPAPTKALAGLGSRQPEAEAVVCEGISLDASDRLRPELIPHDGEAQPFR